jgi:hypothetical protein
MQMVHLPPLAPRADVHPVSLYHGDGGRGRKARHCNASLFQRDFFIHHLLVQIRLIIRMILVDWPCAMRV